MKRLMMAFALSVGAPSAAFSGDILVFAASSLKPALDPAAALWQAETGTGVVISYGGTSALARQIEASCLYNSEHSLPMGPVASRAESSRVEYPPAAILEANPIKGFLMESFRTLNDIDDEIFVDPVEVEEKLVVFADSSVGVPVHLPIESVTTDLPNVIPLAVSVQNIQEILENVSISASTEVIHEIIEGACNTNETAVALATTDETVASPAMLHNVDDDENMPSSNAVLKV